jgi:hypothetical protein
MPDIEDGAEQGDKGASKKKRTRSPMYPVFGLEEAIRRANQLYEGAHHHSTSVESAAEFWRIKSTSSALLQTVSALKQFLLVNDSKVGGAREIQLTETSLDILHHEEGSPERTAAIKTAALSPKLHAEIWSLYGGELPPTDSPIKSFLLRHRAFNSGAVDDFIKQMRGTFAFANLSKDDKVMGSEEVQSETQTANPQSPFRPPVSTMVQTKPPPASAHTVPPSAFTPPVATGGQRDLPITLPSLELAVLRVPVPMTEEDFTALMSTLNAMKKRLVNTGGTGASGQ